MTANVPITIMGRPATVMSVLRTFPMNKKTVMAASNAPSSMVNITSRSDCSIKGESSEVMVNFN